MKPITRFYDIRERLTAVQRKVTESDLSNLTVGMFAAVPAVYWGKAYVKRFTSNENESQLTWGLVTDVTPASSMHDAPASIVMSFYHDTEVYIVPGSEIYDFQVAPEPQAYRENLWSQFCGKKAASEDSEAAPANQKRIVRKPEKFQDEASDFSDSDDEPVATARTKRRKSAKDITTTELNPEATATSSFAMPRRGPKPKPTANQRHNKEYLASSATPINSSSGNITWQLLNHDYSDSVENSDRSWAPSATDTESSESENFDVSSDDDSLASSIIGEDPAGDRDEDLESDVVDDYVVCPWLENCPDFRDEDGHNQRLGPTLRRAALHDNILLDLFVTLFPMDFVSNIIVPETNKAMAADSQPNRPPQLTGEEFLKWVGLRLLASLHPGRQLSALWNTDSVRGDPCHNFGQYGMTFRRFKCINRFLQIAPHSASYSSPMNEFTQLLSAWHSNMLTNFTPGDVVCIDESMCTWMNKHSIPHWRMIKRKPHPFGQEWHDAADGESKLIFALQLADKQCPTVDNISYKSKMCGIVMHVCEKSQLFHSNRIIVADSAFGGFELSRALFDHGLYSVLAIKARVYWPKSTHCASYINRVKNESYGTTIGRRGTTLLTSNYRYLIAGLAILSLHCRCFRALYLNASLLIFANSNERHQA